MVARFCSMDVPAEVTAAVLRPVLAAMLRAGFTGVVDAGGPGVEGAWRAAADVGIRAAVGPSLADLWHDDTGRLVRQADAAAVLARAEAFVKRDEATGRLRPLASAVETMACSDELLAGIAELARAHDLPTHVHSHISADDVREHEEAFGCGPTERLARAGLLSERCTVMHAGSLSDDDVRAFAAAGVTVNHNPTGNALNGFGVTAGRTVPRLLEAGVPVVLGSDFAPTVADPFEMMRAALMLQRDLAARDDALTLEQALAMATGGAAPLGRPGRLGRIEAGALADLVLVDVTGPHHLASTHPVPALALHARAGDVRTVVVGGEIVVEDGHLVSADEPALVADARDTLRHLAA
jgi:5-methylthioadenosine/S-adenosylhomocysteine deaminase